MANHTNIGASAGSAALLRLSHNFRRGEFHESLTNEMQRKWGLVELAPPIRTTF